MIGYASVKYITEEGEDQVNENQYINKAMRISIASIESAQNEYDFEVVREFVNFTSHLYVFNCQTFRPRNYFEFCLFLNQAVEVDEAKKI